MCASDELTAVNSVIQVIFQCPVTNCSVFSGDLDPMMMAVMAGGHIFCKFAFHGSKHTVTAFIAAAGGVVHKDKIIREAFIKTIPVLLIQTIPVIGLKPLDCANILLNLNSSFEFF